VATVKSPAKVQQPAKQQAATQEPTHAQIEERAYYRYLERGCLDGSDLDDWFAAEADLRFTMIVASLNAGSWTDLCTRARCPDNGPLRIKGKRGATRIIFGDANDGCSRLC
jgi:DUF2934 family protein